MTTQLKIETFPNEAAVAYIKGKAVADPKNFGNLPNQLKQWAFAVAGIEQLDAVRRIKDAVAKLPQGASWDEAKKEIAEVMSTYTGGDMKAARARAEHTLRIQGFQAYAVARHQEQMATVDILPYWKYVTVGDTRVRAAHAKLDGKVLRADDDWWKTHYPPWDWGCRCIVESLTERQARKEGISEHNDMPTPERSGTYSFDPTNVALDIEKFHADPRFKDEADWNTLFVNPAKNVRTERANGTECTMWELCMDTKYAPIAQDLAKKSWKDKRERAILIDAMTGAQIEMHEGGATSVETGQTVENGAKTATLHTHTGFSSYPSPTDIRSSLVSKSVFDYIAVPGQLRRIDRGNQEISDADRRRVIEFAKDNDNGSLDIIAWQKFVNGLIAKKIIKMVRAV